MKQLSTNSFAVPLMALYQRRLASSAYALRRSLENRAKRLADNLKRAQEIALTASDLPDPEELEEMEETERDRVEKILEAITIAQNPAQVREEIADLEQLAKRAAALEEAQAEAKLAKLRQVLKEQGFFDNSGERLLIFTEFKDTLDYLVDNLTKWGFQGRLHPRRDEVRLAGRAGHAPLRRAAVPGRRRSRSSSPPRPPAKASTSSAATSCSTTTSRGTRTAWSSGWAASTATARPGLPDLQLRRDQHRSRAMSSTSCWRSCRRFATRSMTTRSSTSSARSCPPPISSASCASTMPAGWAMPISKSDCCAT